MADPANNFNTGEISAVSTGVIFFAPKGSTAPADATVALDAAFKSVGLITDDGLNIAPGKNTEDKKAFNQRGVAKRIPGDGEFAFKFTMMQNNIQTHTLYFGSAPTALTTTGHTRTAVPSVSDVTEHMYVLQFITTDGYQYRWVAPNGVVTDLDDYNTSTTDLPQYGVTVGAQIPTAGGDLAYKLSNEPGLVAAS